ncbi:hypothetical protein U9M48_006058 [Paspalum notatum var. saurae]|uniref:Uncharacterized protein n=1 Tax=Paspalum notatum var. saurae TaxID=547442 RepID=A0AAQ3SLL9_PASNO
MEAASTSRLAIRHRHRRQSASLSQSLVGFLLSNPQSEDAFHPARYLSTPPFRALASYGLRLPTATAMPPPAHDLPALAASALGVALGARLLVALSRSRALKPLADATSAAVAALRAPRALAAASSPVAALLAASKAASKSYKAARTLGPAARLPKLPSSKRLKAAFAAASLLRLAAAAPALPAASHGGVAVLAVLKSSYKLSKNTSKIVEGFLGLQVHKGFRNGIDALGVVVKVAVIASEVAVWVGGQFWGFGGRGTACRVRVLGGSASPGRLVLLGCTKSQPQVVLFDDPVVVDMDAAEGCQLQFQEERGGPELLSLAVPVPVPCPR